MNSILEGLKRNLIEVILIILPPLTAYLTQVYGLFDYLVVLDILSELHATYLKELIFFSGISIPPLILAWLHILSKNKCKESFEQRDALLFRYKTIFIEYVENKIEMPEFKNVNIRIFIEKKSTILTIKNWLIKVFKKNSKPSKYFELQSLKTLVNTGINKKLEFEVTPIPRGLVGRCYNEKEILIAEQLKGNTQDFNLNNYQKNRTLDVMFCACVPIFNDNDTIVAIVSFDSTSDIRIPPNCKEEFVLLITKFSQELYDNLLDII